MGNIISLDVRDKLIENVSKLTIAQEVLWADVSVLKEFVIEHALAHEKMEKQQLESLKKQNEILTALLEGMDDKDNS